MKIHSHGYTQAHTQPLKCQRFSEFKFPTVELNRYVLETLSPSSAAHCLNFSRALVTKLHIFPAC